MQIEPYRSDADLAEPRQAHDLLTAAGVTTGANGLDMDALAPSLTRHGRTTESDIAARVMPGRWPSGSSPRGDLPRRHTGMIIS